MGPDEAQRFAASAPKPDVRFHYRTVALERAVAAADLLPVRSQAYAATLCWASRFAFDANNDDRAREIYQRYVEDRRLPVVGQDVRPRLSAARLRGGSRLLDEAERALAEAQRGVYDCCVAGRACSGRRPDFSAKSRAVGLGPDEEKADDAAGQQQAPRTTKPCS